MVIIYCPESSVRFSYSVKLIFSLMPGANYVITNDKDNLLNNNDARINYSNDTVTGAINIKPHGLLTEETIHPIAPETGVWQTIPTIFPTNGDVPFDIFSGAFFFASRYEEYTDKTRDQHGRYTATQSFAYKNNLLHLPLINCWANELRKLLNETFGLGLQPLHYSYVPTIDIDQAYYYKYRPLYLSFLGGAKQLLKGNFDGAFCRLQVLSGLKTDPNFTFDLLEKMHRASGLSAIYFFHVGTGGLHDPVPLYSKKTVSEVIKSLSATNAVGIHPSYLSFNNEGIILAEIMRLERIIGKGTAHSRQHFLRFNLPDTFRVLLACGITDEYSMGYADVVGYRAAISAPYFWFDLEKNEETPLTLHPFGVMDVTLKNYMGLNEQSALEKIKQVNAPLKKHGGTFMSLWHNESVGEHGEWKGWSNVYQGLLNICTENEN